MSFRSLASLRCAVSLAAVLAVSACSNDRPAPLSEIDVIDVPVADPGTQANQNISNPTLFIPDTFQVADGDELGEPVWSEEFDGPDIDPEVWFFESGDGSQYGFGQVTGKAPGWGNNELQYYLPDNAMIVNGVLEITARREAVGDFNYTSARINTRDRFAFKYGRIEASIKLPAGQGLWPAFWMLSQDSDYLCDGTPCEWAATGEIDIVEAVNLDGTGGNEIFNTIHYGGEETKFQQTSSGTTYTPGVDVTENFHTYALEWDENEFRWYFNGELIAMENSWFSTADNGGPGAPFDQPFHILLNLAVGGNFPGDPNGATPFPATMQVDWVRVYSGEDPSGTAATEPNVSAPTPTEDAANVISLFSDAYDDIAGIDYNPNWGQGTVVTIAQIAGNQMLKYAGLDYQGTDFAGNPQDVSDKGFLHLDFWTADSTALNVYLISPGPAETAYALPITPNSWVSVDIPLTEFAGVDLTNVIQMKFDGNGTIFLDNLYFAGDAPITAPTVGAPAPMQDEADVISLFSGAYTDEPVTWPTVWSDVGAVTDVTIDGELVKEHLGVNFVGVEFSLDASAMTHLHVDVWTPDADSLLIRLVDFLGDGFAGPNGDTQGELTFDLSATQGEWVSLDIPLADFQAAGLTSLTDLNQLVIDPTPDGTTLYTANVYFYNADGGGSGGELLTNGDMEAGQAPWIGQATVVDDAGNSVLQGVVTAPDPGQPFLVNASQVVALTQDETYTLTFRARATVARNMIAGIGLNVGPFTAVVETVPLTTEWQAFTYTLKATGFGGPDSRVLFDMNGEAGDVFIDDVSLTGGSLLTNGDMEAGQAPWIGQATVVDDGGNNVLQGVVTAPDPGQPFLVNASQVFDITQDETYVLTFKARATVARNMIAGLGLNVGPFTNVTEIVPLTTAWQTFTYTITATGFGGADSRVLFDMNGEAGDVFIDDVAVAVLGPIGGGGGPGGGELLTNGDMEAGQAPWIGQATVVDDGGNNVLQGVVTAPDPGQPFLVNASQVVALTQDETYTLTFRAKAAVARNMIAGIGLNVGPFTNVSEIVPLTTEWQAYTYTLTATGFGGPDSRVLFDMNGEAGDVFIDDVSLTVGSLLTNGDMEAGQAPWIGQATVVDDGGNSVLQGVVTAPDPGQPFLVNASQVFDITQDEIYVLTFKARATVDRNMIAGLGLNVGPFTNVSEIVPLTTAWQTFTYTITATGFGGADSRVLFDMNGEAGDVFIDDVAVAVLGPIGGGGGPGGGEIAVNGGFESGDFTGWTQFEATPGDQTVNTGMAGDTSSEGTFHLEINNMATGTNSLVKQERVGLGTVTPGIDWTVTFDARGSLANNAVAFAQVFSETAGGSENCTGCGILGGAPLAIDADSTVWTSFSFFGTAGPTTESLTLQLEAVTSGDAGSVANMFYDNISIAVN